MRFLQIIVLIVLTALALSSCATEKVEQDDSMQRCQLTCGSVNKLCGGFYFDGLKMGFNCDER